MHAWQNGQPRRRQEVRRAPHMCLKKGSCSSTVATNPFMGAGTCVSGSPHSGNDSQLPILHGQQPLNHAAQR